MSTQEITSTNKLHELSKGEKQDQYTLWQILGIWASGALPMGFSYWAITSILLSHVCKPIYLSFSDDNGIGLAGCPGLSHPQARSETIHLARFEGQIMVKHTNKSQNGQEFSYGFLILGLVLGLT